MVVKSVKEQIKSIQLKRICEFHHIIDGLIEKNCYVKGANREIDGKRYVLTFKHDENSINLKASSEERFDAKLEAEEIYDVKIDEGSLFSSEIGWSEISLKLLHDTKNLLEISNTEYKEVLKRFYVYIEILLSEDEYLKSRAKNVENKRDEELLKVLRS